MQFTLSFDADGAYDEFYDDLYCWVHLKGGYRFVPAVNGDGWLRMASTTIVLNYNLEERSQVAEAFKKNVKDTFGVELGAVSVVRGAAWTLGTKVKIPPDYVTDPQGVWNRRAARQAITSGRRLPAR